MRNCTEQQCNAQNDVRVFDHIKKTNYPMRCTLSVQLKPFPRRLYGFKIHPLAYQIQQQAAANFKAPLRSLTYNNGKR